ncbi:YqzE family protein [Oceanobacillus sp. J11TS1]|uniref:YqzE family protein n=1 Tax=Oceanobacillus sp. J11TS1 TaxID=2807191 RepID=UPI001B207181|nr:YqzE family protein [Oceanobacillus sp. J11TS1]GIO23148.1 YqzE family protein [Oceanobacillus sp. J11TS1]
MKSNDYIRFLTEEMMKYMHLSAEEKKERKQKKKTSNPFYSNRWLGVIPFSIQSWYHNKSTKRSATDELD